MGILRDAINAATQSTPLLETETNGPNTAFQSDQEMRLIDTQSYPLDQERAFHFQAHPLLTNNILDPVA